MKRLQVGQMVKLKWGKFVSIDARNVKCSIVTFGENWCHILQIALLKVKNLFNPADNCALCNAFSRSFIGENLDISPSRIMVRSGDWFHLICIKSLLKDKNFLNPADKSALCKAFFRNSIGEYLYISPSRRARNCSILQIKALYAMFFRNFLCENLDISPSITRVLSGDWSHLICIQLYSRARTCSILRTSALKDVNTLYLATNIKEIW